ncbi:MAG: PilZ domain-containing protein [Acidobacteriota bacterium]|nr:PilZ domain-containing protein [Acidobacteriota bacterium]
MVGNDRRDFERLRLAKPILALLDGQNALILDIGISGAYVEHYGQASAGDRFTLLFRWKGTDVEFVSEVAHTVIVRKTGNAAVSHTGLRFVQAMGDAEKRLNDMVATFVGKVLAAQKANAGATQPSDSALLDLGGARRSRTRSFLTYRFQNGSWSREITDSSAQPNNGFTVAGYEDDQELESLCQAYEIADEEGRRLIKLVAELSARTVKKT